MYNKRFLQTGIALFILLAASMTAQGIIFGNDPLQLRGYWKLNGDTVILKNIDQNVNVGADETTTYKLNVDGTQRVVDNATFLKKMLFPNSIDIGKDNSALGFNYIVMGEDNFDEGFNNILIGFTNFIDGTYGTSYAVVIGSQNLVGQTNNADGCVIVGESNIIDGLENSVIGSMNTIDGDRNALVGSGMTFTGDDTFYTNKKTFIDNTLTVGASGDGKDIFFFGKNTHTFGYFDGDADAQDDFLYIETENNTAIHAKVTKRSGGALADYAMRLESSQIGNNQVAYGLLASGNTANNVDAVASWFDSGVSTGATGGTKTVMISASNGINQAESTALGTQNSVIGTFGSVDAPTFSFIHLDMTKLVRMKGANPVAGIKVTGDLGYDGGTGDVYSGYFDDNPVWIGDDVNITGITNSTGGFATDVGPGLTFTFTCTEGIVTVTNGIITGKDW